MAKNGDGEFAFSICQIRHFAIGPPPPRFLSKLKLKCLKVKVLPAAAYSRFKRLG